LGADFWHEIAMREFRGKILSKPAKWRLRSLAPLGQLSLLALSAIIAGSVLAFIV
jgi:hypothetical protein